MSRYGTGMRVCCDSVNREGYAHIVGCEHFAPKPTEITQVKLDEMLAAVEEEQANAIADAEADQNPQLAIGAVAEFDLGTMRTAIARATGETP